jgi:hypothetical protein
MRLARLRTHVSEDEILNDALSLLLSVLRYIS